MKLAEGARNKSNATSGVGRAVVAYGVAAIVLAGAGFGAYSYFGRLNTAVSVSRLQEKPVSVVRVKTPGEIPFPGPGSKAIQQASNAKSLDVAKRPATPSTRMSPQDWRDLDQALAEEVKRCWKYPDTDNSTSYTPKFKVEFAPDGSVARAPVVLNAEENPAAKAIAASASKAMSSCLKVAMPPRLHANYDEWKVRVIDFNGAT
jgi:hypothetical protein